MKWLTSKYLLYVTSFLNIPNKLCRQNNLDCVFNVVKFRSLWDWILFIVNVPEDQKVFSYPTAS